MKRSIFVAVIFFIAGFVAAVSTAALAEDTNQRLPIIPMVVSLRQSVPITLTVRSGASGTIGIPANVDVGLTVRIEPDGKLSPTVAVGEASAPVVGVATAVPAEEPAAMSVDVFGVPYQVDSIGGVVVDQINSRPVLDNFAVVGLVRNDSERTFRQFDLKINLMSFDAGGNLLDVTPGFLDIATFDPGETAPFNIVTLVDSSNVARYLVQIRE